MPDQQELNRRNTESAFQALREFETMMRAMRLELDTLNGLMAQLNERLRVIEIAMAEQRIKTIGSGPTEQRHG